MMASLIFLTDPRSLAGTVGTTLHDDLAVVWLEGEIDIATAACPAYDHFSIYPRPT